MEWGAVEVVVILVLVLVGWLHVRQNNLETKLENNEKRREGADNALHIIHIVLIRN